MGRILYIIGIVLAAYSGYNDFAWYFIFMSSLIMSIGYSIIRAPQIHGAISSDGIGALPKLLLIQVVLYLIITAPIYFIASLFN